jgi:prepilin-type N-terminal cleavage/methylation domain-containing protein
MKNVRKLPRGFSLIEMIVFIVITGIAVTTLAITLQTVLQKSPLSNIQTTAIGLAQERMDLILGQKQEKGFTNFFDPCKVASPPSYCLFTGYNIDSTISTTTISGDSNYKIISVIITNSSGTTLVTLKTLVGS